MELKFVLAIASSILAIIVFIPYFIDIFKQKTQPHLYSWLIWGILQIVGTAAALKAGAGFGSWALGVGALFCLLIFLLSFKYGTKNIHRSDLFCLIAAFVAIGMYFLVENPLYSVLLVALTDFIGFLPTFRKAHQEPWSETFSTFFLSAVANVMSLAALEAYSLTTALYLSSLFVTNGVMCLILYFGRRRMGPNAQIQ
ncbi:MAG TPA: hypothetical protein VGE35_01465 [Candidatus Paceibacterota bacterium]